MRDHAGAQASATNRQQAKERAIRSNHQHSRESLVSVCAAKEQCGQQHTQPQSSARSRELLLKVSAKEKLFADAGRYAQRDPERRFCKARWGELADLLLRTLEMEKAEKVREHRKHHKRKNPEERSGADINKKFSCAAPPLPEQFAQRRLL